MPTPLWTLGEEPTAELAALLLRVAEATRAEGRVVPREWVPSAAELRQLVEAAFWASTIPDEGRVSRFQLVFAPADDDALRVEERALDAGELARLAPLTVTGARIGVGRGKDGGLQIWGLVPGATTFLEIRSTAPGQLVVALSFMNLAVFSGGQYRLLARTVDGRALGRGRSDVALALATNFAGTQDGARRTLTGLFLLAATEAMRSHGSGGMIVVVANEPEPRRKALAWLDLGRNRARDAFSLAGLYELYVPRLKDAADPMQAAFRVGGLSGFLTGSVEDTDADVMLAARVVGGLTALDGAVVLSESLDVIGFGATIRQPAAAAGSAHAIFRCSFFELEPAPRGADVDFSRLGGTRRQAAARLVAHNSGTIAITASHDGPLSLALWAKEGRSARAARPMLVTDLEKMLD